MGIATGSLCTALIEFCVQTEKTYHQGQTLIGNWHANCLDRFQLPRGNVTIVFLTTYKIYLCKCFRKFNTLRVRGCHLDALFLNNVRTDRTPALPYWKMSAFVYRLETAEILLRFKLVLNVPPVLQVVHQLLKPSVYIGVSGTKQVLPYDLLFSLY